MMYPRGLPDIAPRRNRFYLDGHASETHGAGRDARVEPMGVTPAVILILKGCAHCRGTKMTAKSELDQASLGVDPLAGFCGR